MHSVTILITATVSVAGASQGAELASEQVLALEGANNMVAVAQTEATRNG